MLTDEEEKKIEAVNRAFSEQILLRMVNLHNFIDFEKLDKVGKATIMLSPIAETAACLISVLSHDIKISEINLINALRRMIQESCRELDENFRRKINSH